MAAIHLHQIPEIIQDIISGRRKIVAYDPPPSPVARFMLPYEYCVLSKRLLDTLEPGAIQNLADPYRLIDALAQEDPAKVVVVASTGSMWEAWKEVEPFGDFPVINYFVLDYLQNFLPALASLPLSYKRQEKRKTGRRGIIIRGPVDDESFFQTIQKIAHDYPDDFFIVSTWDTLKPDEISRLNSLCDLVILNKRPTISGIQNRNSQLACIRPGIQAALDAGVEKILLVRSDHFLANPNMAAGFDALLEAYPSEVAREHGQKARLVVPDFATRTYLPYHPSDILMYGWAQDVARYWLDIPDDLREMKETDYPKFYPVSIKDFSRLQIVAENYFSSFFMQKIGWTPHWTVADSMQFYRDYFIIIDGANDGLFWFRKFWYNRGGYMSPLSSLMTHAKWRSLSSGTPANQVVEEQDLAKLTWGEFCRVN